MQSAQLDNGTNSFTAVNIQHSPQVVTHTASTETSDLDQALTTQNDKIHLVCYKNQYTDSYKVDVRFIRQILNNNINCINPDERLKLII